MALVAAHLPKVNEEADGQHGNPGGDVDESLEDGAEHGRASDAEGVEQEPHRDAEQAHLIEREEHLAEALEAVRLADGVRLLYVAVLGHREDDEHEHDVLARADDLRVGEALLGIEDEGADATERADVREHGTRDVGAAVEPARIMPGEEQAADGAWHEDQQEAEEQDDQQVPRDRQDPETQQGEDGVDADDVEADELVDGLVRDEMALVQVVADGQRRDEVGQHEDQPQIHSVHVVTSF